LKPYESGENRRRITLDIRDNGRGIEPAIRKNIFKPGFSTKKRGWGLGLSLAKRIIEDYHHGKLYLQETRVGEGSTMRIVL
jgi:signal transduction histidine kinase